MIYEFKSQEELINAFTQEGGVLKGLLPSKGFDSKELQYPIKIETNDTSFILYVEPIVEQVKETPKKKLSKKAILGMAIGIPCGVVLIIAIVLACVFLSGCAHYKTQCVQYDKNGNCVAEQIIYKKVQK